MANEAVGGSLAAGEGLTAEDSPLLNTGWAIVIAREDVIALAPLRLFSSIEVAEAEAMAWVRSRDVEESLLRLLPTIPAVARYEWRTDNRLRPMGSRIPAETFPVLKWQPLNSWLQADFPGAASPAKQSERVPLQLVRTAEERNSNLLLTDLKTWLEFAASAAEIRLATLEFAVNEEGKVLVRGAPLPPLPGLRFVEQDGIAVPAGFTWNPAVSVQVMKRALGVGAGALAILREDGTFWRLQAEQFMRATRAAVRASRATAASL